MDRACGIALERMDAYLDRALPLEQEREMDAHMSCCPACMGEADVRTQMRSRLRSAVRASVETPAFLESRIRANLEAPPKAAWWKTNWAPAAALAALCFAGVIAYQLNDLRLNTASQDSYIAAVSNRVASIMRVGLRDHIHCAVFRQYPKDAPAAETLAKKLGPEYAGLIPIVKARVPKEYRLMEGHECGYRGRRFVHLAMHDGSRVLSLVIAKKEDGESFATEGLVPALQAAGQPLYGARAEKFEIAGFESPHHLVYVISDLPKEQNMEMMLAMAADLRRHLKPVEL